MAVTLSGRRIAGPFDAYDLHSSAMAAVEEPTTLEWDSPLWRTALAQFEAARSSTRRSRRGSPSGSAIRSASVVVSVPIHLDSGDVGVFPAYRVQHSTVLGPTKGGVRYDPHVSLGECAALAMWMTWKCALSATSVRRRKGGRSLQPAGHVHGRDRAAHAALHGRADAGNRPEGGHPGARHGHGRADDGLDDGHVLDAGGPRGSGDRDRQADLSRRLAVPSRGDGRRRRDGDRPRVRAAGLEPRRATLCRPGLRQGGRRGRSRAGRPGRDRRRHRRLLGRAVRRERARRGGADGVDRRRARRSPTTRDTTTSRTRRCSSCPATCSCSRRSRIS